MREEWIQAVQLKSSTTLGDPGKSLDSTPARKHMAKKSGSGQQRPASRVTSSEGDPQKGPSKSSQSENLGQRDEPVEELGGEPGTPLGTPSEGTTPPGTIPKGTTPPGTIPKGTTPPGTIPKGTAPTGTTPKSTTPKGTVPKGAKPHELVPKNTGRVAPGGQRTWYKSNVVYGTKRTGPAAIPPDNVLEVTRKRKTGDQPKSTRNIRLIRDIDAESTMLFTIKQLQIITYCGNYGYASASVKVEIHIWESQEHSFTERETWGVSSLHKEKH